MEKAVTIYDVAKAAGVAPSTVSRAFSRPGRLNAATAERILRVGAALGYQRGGAGRDGAGSAAGAADMAGAPGGGPGRPAAHMIALIVPDITNPFYFEIIRGAERAASEAGFTLVLSDTQESRRLERDALERTSSVVAGLLLTSTRMDDSEIVAVSRRTPLVVLNREVDGVPSVVTDNRAGARQAVEHLVDLGHSSVTYVAGPEASWADRQRWTAAQEACLERGVGVRRVGPFAPTVDAGRYAAQAVLGHPGSAVLCYNDQLAIGLIRGLGLLGARVPDDVSIIGFDNTLVADLVTPGITTVAAPLDSLGATGVNGLIGLVTGRRRPDPLVVLPSMLVVRGSTAAAVLWRP
ncbi:LacI family DNA-binding transcriptional regulator [Intrasporangium calvum]|uniref:Transcriptional regulator, LacI family n=1 Tax=Intrasporangium calvum (strain ATCC 23552 / DSM 43043 / JCM 3097 / NBRC 12989 / NCIMB 10167 / NRRL B-3866 / 7 KIP) TaxID=710696 RepID=E6S740_INTC7|nr:LacI family DNA-binding transcriptional regulator [Intrasporangium calvum]ADU48974.1 transcriptional regulator, LacI family [Intrasporangium calvum DSM 43043]